MDILVVGTRIIKRCAKTFHDFVCSLSVTKWCNFVICGPKQTKAYYVTYRQTLMKQI